MVVREASPLCVLSEVEAGYLEPAMASLLPLFQSGANNNTCPASEAIASDQRVVSGRLIALGVTQRGSAASLMAGPRF
jgi:thiamine biosynthesis lipoprotein ApbE